MFGDLAVMYSFEEYQYFLLVVDGFSSKVFVRPLKSKKSSASNFGGCRKVTHNVRGFVQLGN